MGWRGILAIGVVGGALVGGCAEKKVAPVKTAPPVGVVDIGISGMHCDGCAMAISDALKQTDGVIECQVSFADG